MEEKRENGVRGYSYEPDEEKPISKVEDKSMVDVENDEYVVINGNARPPEELAVDPKTDEPKVSVNKDNEREGNER